MINAFSFGRGLKNSSLSNEAMKLLSSIGIKVASATMP